MKHAVPPAVTGKGSGLAAGGSVLDHNFGKGEAFTLGVSQVVKCGASPAQTSWARASSREEAQDLVTNPSYR
jgi:hypothetical protein